VVVGSEEVKRKSVLASMLLVTLVFTCVGSGGQSFSSSGKAHAKKSAKRKVQLAPVGYILLPKGYKVFREVRHKDTWHGYIESPDGSFRIEYWGGMVQSPFENGEDKFVWVKRENISHGVLRYGLKHMEGGDVVAASVPWLNFTAPIKREGDLDLFLDIVRSHRMEQCKDCEFPSAAPSNKALQLTAR
jgi:hypothetical protein